jgi:hypothetical protein
MPDVEAGPEWSACAASGHRPGGGPVEPWAKRRPWLHMRFDPAIRWFVASHHCDSVPPRNTL